MAALKEGLEPQIGLGSAPFHTDKGGGEGRKRFSGAVVEVEAYGRRGALGSFLLRLCSPSKDSKKRPAGHRLTFPR
ncbi:hypothetical protein BHE74_00004822 [Ensete ventricosum]|nr:hypothetical protein BHE74_00004822 [Ensete ventricosum]RZR78299.1 hypothetical protein BHM03_00003571 [Ensete ventricosum]